MCPPPSLTFERDPVVGPVDLAILDLGLRHRGPEVHVPHRGRVGRVREPATEEPEEPSLRGPPRGVLRSSCTCGTSRPTARAGGTAISNAFSSSAVRRSQSSMKFARLTGTGWSSGRSKRGDVEVRVLGQRRVTAHAEVVLHAALGRQPVVVPAHRIEHLVAPHPAETRHEVGVGVALDGAEVQRPARRRRRRVDGVDLLAALRAIEAIGARGLPPLAPLGLQAIERRFVGNVHAVSLRNACAAPAQASRPPREMRRGGAAKRRRPVRAVRNCPGLRPASSPASSAPRTPPR